MSSNTESLPSWCRESIDYKDGDLKTVVESLMRSGICPDSMDEHDIKKIASAIRSDLHSGSVLDS
jgi:hypothetical protein